ncbi:MAG: hypothetical protein J6U93_05770 [Alistipes sp.]|nr:hypothetical protein [Alistipes sp.]
MKRLLFFTLLVTIFTACMQDSIDEVSRDSSRPEYIYATFEDDTRVELNENKKTVWTEGDKIVLYANGKHEAWSFTGKTGDRGGSFVYLGYYSGVPEFDFGDKCFAFYSCDNYGGFAYFNTGEPAIFHYVRPEQQYKPNTYDPQSNAMIGVSDDGKNFTFRNLMGHLRLSLTGDKRVEKIILRGNQNEVINGMRYVKYDDTEVYNWYSDYTAQTTLVCNGVQLTDIPTEFYFTLAPTYFSSGISVEVHFTDGTFYPIRTTKVVSIERNTIQPMATVDTGDDIEWQTITIKHRGSIASTPVLYGDSNIVSYTYWGDGFMTDTNIDGSYVYSDGLDEHEIMVKSQNATYLYLGSCAGISEIDLSNF